MSNDVLYHQAATILRQGGIVAMPTEGVWGLSCDPNNPVAIHKLLTLKGRAPEKGFILIAASLSQLLPFLATLPPEKLNQLLPSAKPTTWIVPARADISALVRGQFSTLAVRITTHPVASEICKAFAGALISTSANISSQSPARNIAELSAQFPTGIDLIVPGELGGLSTPTEIRDVMTGEVVRG